MNVDSYKEWLPPEVISRISIETRGEKLQSLTYDLGCGWTDSEGNKGTKMRYSAESGEYRAVN